MAQVESGYPDLQAIFVTSDLPTTLENARKTALELAWEVVDVNAEAGLLEARETSRVFQFVDDVVVRVRATPEGARVDVRSRSRDGRGDLGVNAARIQRFFAALPRS